MTALLAGIFFLSGAAGLVFETLWFRQAGLAFGNSFWASSIVLSSFMAGLGLGNGIVAWLGARVRAPLRAYAVLEIAIALGGVALVWGLPSLTPLLAGVLSPFVEQPWLLNALRLSLGFVLLAIPATAMGATLPLLVRVLAARDASFGSALGRLYGWNTLGAVCGCLAGEIALIEAFGIRGSALVAASANGVAAIGGLWLARRLGSDARAGEAPQAQPTTAFARRTLLAAALSGAILLALEVVWFRFMHLFTHAGAVAFAVMLAVVLAGIALGGLLAGTWSRRDSTADRWLPVLALAAGALLVATYACFGLALGDYGSTLRDFWNIVRLSAFLMFPSAMLSGVLFTLLGVALQRELVDATRSAGFLTLANTAGAATGSLLAGFALLPLIGIEGSFALLAALYAGVALLAYRGRISALRPALVAGALLLVGLVLFPFGRLRDDYLMRSVSASADPEAVVAVREGRIETAVLLHNEFLGEKSDFQLMTDAYAMAGNQLVARRYMKFFVYWPVALRPDPKAALLISYGVGSTAKALTDTASLEHIDVVDISRETLGLADLIYPDAAENPLRDPRVHVHVEDGRYFLQTTPRRYDLITGEPPPPKAAGVESLYTREYFTLVHERLAEGGITTYWLPMHSLAATDALSIVRGFCDVFEDCSLWTAAGNEWMLVGSRGGIERVSEAGFAAQWSDPRVGRDLRELGFEKPEAVGATFIADAAQLRETTEKALPLVDDYPKRLSDGLFTGQGAAVPMTSWALGGDITRKRFRESAYVRDIWPAALRKSTLAEFDDYASVTPMILRRWDALARLASVHRVLTQTELTTIPLWMFGQNADRVRSAERAALRNADEPGVQRVLGLTALAEREYATASETLGRAWQAEPDEFSTFYWMIYALCADGRADAAMQQVAAERSRLPDESRDRVFWHWLGRTFDVEVPTGS